MKTFKRKNHPIHERVYRHHRAVAIGLFAIASCHVLFPELGEYVNLIVGLYWVGDPSSNLES